MKSDLSISVVIPLYKCENCIRDWIKTIISILKNYSFEIILVDDNSPDDTWKKVVELKHHYPEIIKAIRLSRNYGQQKATFCGLSKAKGDIVITIDDDGVHPVEHLPEVIEKFLSEKMEILYIIPEKYHYPLYRKLLSSVYKKISQIENPEAGKGSSFRILSKNLVKSIIQHSSHLIVIDELILWYTQNIHSIVIPFHLSKKKKSSYSFSRLFHLSKSTLMISTTMPLIIVKTLGLTVSGISFLAGVYFLIKKFVFHHAEKGYTSIIVSILFGVGLILFSLGVIGEYIAYILMDIHKKPPYHIKEEL
ncbi:MAG: glycosyl transferase CsbB [Bacteroidia bacterium]|nr:MAG: glycosyl transferase CsbB [Bacteroidia bacterium]